MSSLEPEKPGDDQNRGTSPKIASSSETRNVNEAEEIGDGFKATTRNRVPPASGQRRPVFPVDKILKMINVSRSTSAEVAIFLGAVEEYIALEILESAGNKASARGSNVISQDDLIAAIFGDDDLRETLQDCM